MTGEHKSVTRAWEPKAPETGVPGSDRRPYLFKARAEPDTAQEKRH